jgi:predicted transcriptional regulator
MKLADYLSDRKISQAEFAHLIGATQAAISRYCDHKRMPRTEHLIRIRKVTGGTVTADDFLPALRRRSSHAPA